MKAKDFDNYKQKNFKADGKTPTKEYQSYLAKLALLAANAD